MFALPHQTIYIILAHRLCNVLIISIFLCGVGYQSGTMGQSLNMVYNRWYAPESDPWAWSELENVTDMTDISV